MTYSLNEIEALSKRAARGAGLSWGLAEEAAKATRWLASHDLPATKALADTLTQNDKIAHCDVAPMSLDGVWSARKGALCPLVSGAALNDCAHRLSAGENIELARVSHPLLLVPFAAWVARHIDTPVAVSWNDVCFTTDGHGLRYDGPADQIEISEPTSALCYAATEIGMVRPPKLRGDVDQEAWARLNSFANRTYAPATEESRLLGAGAGVSDND